VLNGGIGIERQDFKEKMKKPDGMIGQK